ncbi:MAG: hypothetical protein ACJ8AG_09095 [Ktedonobacteraceae bacterium]
MLLTPQPHDNVAPLCDREGREYPSTPVEIDWLASSSGVLTYIVGYVGPPSVFSPFRVDSKTGGQQHISMDTHGHSIGLWSGR